VLGEPVSMPVVAPTALKRLAHAEGELASARGTQARSSPSVRWRVMPSKTFSSGLGEPRQTSGRR
jgi:isopentenyl diphosphate isomerase/L-lactate dehydrogenase-like FMN-dependent dehydrogenase